MKRIAIWGYFGGYGGIERMVYNFYKHMDKTKIQYDFLVPHDFGKIAFEDEILAMGGRVFRILYSERESLIKSRTCWMKYFKEHPEVQGIHVHANFPYAFPLKMAKKAGVGIRIIHAHNSNIASKPNSIIKKIREKHIRKMIKKYPNKYVACGETAARFMFGEREYIWIKNGIEIDKFKYDELIRKEQRNEYGFQDDEIVLGQIGHLTDVKQPLYSVELLKEVTEKNRKVKLVFAGQGPLEEKIKSKIREYNLENNAIILGGIPDVSRLYQTLDVLLLPSLYEGFPVVLVEAQAIGVQCLVSSNVTKQTIQTDLCKMISLDDREKWIEEIVRFRNDKDRFKYNKIMDDAGFDIKRVAHEVEMLYE